LVLIVNNVYEAVQHLDTYPDIRLMLLDIDLPEMSAFHLLAVLKMNEKYNAVRVLIISQNNKFNEMMKGPELSLIDYIHKPIDPEPLKIIVRLQNEISSQNTLVQKMSDTNYIFDLLFNGAPFGIAITRVDLNSKNYNPISVSVNPAYERIIGRKNDGIETYDWRRITHPDDLRVSEMYYERLINGELKSYSRENRYILPDGKVVWVYMVVSAIDTKSEDVFSHLTLIEDITSRKKIEQDLVESERSKSVLLSHIPGMAYRCDYKRDWTMHYVSSGARDLTGYDADSLIDNRDVSYNQIIAPPYRTILWKEWSRTIKAKQKFRYSYQIVTKGGDWKWVYELGEPIYDKDGKIEALEGIVIDISVQKQMENALQYKTDHDSLTDLLNRNFLERLLAAELKAKTLVKGALIGINLNSVQTLTSAHGYHYSQNLMKKVVNIIKDMVCAKCQLFLTHENCLTLYVKDYEAKSDLMRLYAKVASALEPLLFFERLNAGVGILEIPRFSKASEVDKILKNLLLASEKAFVNDEKPIHYIFFDVEMEAKLDRESKIQKELAEVAKGIAEDRLFLQYQPIINLKNNQVSGFEALARLKSTEFGIVPPLDFIPLLEKSKLIIPLGEVIVRKSLMFLKRLHDSGYEDVSMSINISAIQLLDPSFTRKFTNMIKVLNVNPGKIWIELTESIFASNYQEINTILGRLREQGIRVAIDDFGTGFSSLYRLLALNVNSIKIDKAFMDGIELINIDEAITKDIVSLGQKLRYIVVAEGVETEIQHRYLLHYGCDRAQGYFFSRPLYDEDALKYVRKHNE
jgi:PAS domain S-box-containing protein